MPVITKRMRRRLQEALADPEQVAADIGRYSRSARAADAQHEQLIQSHDRRWVAFFDGQLVADDSTLAGVLARLDEIGVPRAHAFVRFVTKDRRTLIV